MNAYTQLLLSGSATALIVLSASTSQAESKSVHGMASYYKSGKRTANGEVYDPVGLTAAHRNLPFGTRVRVTNLKNGKWVVVRINDRGPFLRSRIIDLSFGAAKIVGLDRMGVAPVEFEELRTEPLPPNM
jgi:rare lipoprotein A